MSYVINVDEHKLTGTHWIALHVNCDNATYFESFGVEYIPKEIKEITGNKNITTNIYRTQANDSIMCRYLCIEFIDFVIKSKSSLDYSNSVSLTNMKRAIK